MNALQRIKHGKLSICLKARKQWDLTIKYEAGRSLEDREPAWLEQGTLKPLE